MIESGEAAVTVTGREMPLSPSFFASSSEYYGRSGGEVHRRPNAGVFRLPLEEDRAQPSVVEEVYLPLVIESPFCS